VEPRERPAPREPRELAVNPVIADFPDSQVPVDLQEPAGLPAHPASLVTQVLAGFPESPS